MLPTKFPMVFVGMSFSKAVKQIRWKHLFSLLWECPLSIRTHSAPFAWWVPLAASLFSRVLDVLLTGQNDSSKSRAITKHHVQSQGTACTEQHGICLPPGVLQAKRLKKQILRRTQPYLNLAILCKLRQVLAAQLQSASLQNLFFPCCGFSTVSKFCLHFLLKISCSENQFFFMLLIFLKKKL